MTQKQCRQAARVALVLGPGLFVFSALGLAHVIPIGEEAMRAAPVACMLGITNFLLGILTLRE